MAAAISVLQKIPAEVRKMAFVIGDVSVVSTYGNGLGPAVLGRAADRAHAWCVEAAYGRTLIDEDILDDGQDVPGVVVANAG
jgi:hypothetical protein